MSLNRAHHIETRKVKKFKTFLTQFSSKKREMKKTGKEQEKMMFLRNKEIHDS